MLETATPERFGPYVVVRKIDEGGMGIVYQARDSRTGAIVAVKTLKASAIGATSMRAEVGALMNISHPGVVRILHDGTKDGIPWFAMEFIEGETWRQFVDRLWRGAPVPASQHEPTGIVDLTDPNAQSTLSTDLDIPRDRPHAAQGHLEEVLTLALRLCAPLAALHARGTIHRDIKPANVMIRNDGTPVIMDLGLAWHDQTGQGRERVVNNAPKAGSIYYMSPEQVEGPGVDPRADLYSLGCVIYEAVTGRLPVQTGGQADLLIRIRNEIPVRASAWVEGVPKELDDLLASLLSKSRMDRLGQAEDVAEALREMGVGDRDAVQEGATGRIQLHRPEIAGREDMLTGFTADIDRLLAGRGAILALAGESGVGKTFLAKEIAYRASSRKARVVGGECRPVISDDASAVDVGGAPLHPFRTVLTAIADDCRAHPDLAPQVLGHRGPILAPYESALATLPAVATLSPPPELPGTLALRRLLDALSDTIAAWVDWRGPLLLILDDLQWADEVTLAWLRQGAANLVAGRKVLVVLTWRSEEAEADMLAAAAAAGTRVVPVPRLGEEAVRAIIGGMLAMREPPAGLVHLVSTQTEGNAYFVAEYLRTAAAEGLVFRAGGRWHVNQEALADNRTLPNPRNVIDLIERRIATLDAPTREMLELAAVIGREVPETILIAAGTSSEAACQERIRRLVERQMLDRSEHGLRFVHDKLREGVHGQIEPERRQALHRAVATAMERSTSAGEPLDEATLARHWTEAHEWARAVDALERAGLTARRVHASHDAATLFAQAIHLADRVPERVGDLRRGRWYRQLAEAQFELGNNAGGMATSHLALRSFGQGDLPRNVVLQVVVLLWELTKRLLPAWWPGLRAATDPTRRMALAEISAVYDRIVTPTLLSNQIPLGTICNLRTINLGEQTDPTGALARGYSMFAYLTGSMPFGGLADHAAAKAVETARSINDPDTLAYVLTRLGAYFVYTADWDALDTHMAEGLAVARGIGQARVIEEGLSIASVGAHARGRLDSAIEGARLVVASATDRGDPETETWGHCLLVHALSEAGRADETGPHRLRLDHLIPTQNYSEQIWAHSALACASLSQSDLQDAHRHVDAAVTLGEQFPLIAYMVVAPFTDAARVAIALWDRASVDGTATAPAAALARRATRVLSRFALLYPYAYASIPFARGGVAWREGRRPRAFGMWEHAAARSPLPMVRAHAHLARGTHDTGAARKLHIESAIALFDGVGAVRHAADARRALERPGPDP